MALSERLGGVPIKPAEAPTSTEKADMEQEAMMTLYQLLEKFPELKSDDDKLRR